MPRRLAGLALTLLAAACAAPLPAPRSAGVEVERAPAPGPPPTAAPEPAPETAPAAPPPAAPIPAGALFAPPAAADPRLSPDGELLAWRVPEAPGELRLARVAAPRIESLAPAAGDGGEAVAAFAWAGDRRLVALRRGDGGWRLEVAELAADGASGEVWTALRGEGGEPALAAVVAGPPARALVAVRRAADDEHVLLAVETAAGGGGGAAAVEVARGGADVEGWLVDGDGRPRAAVRREPDGAWTLVRVARGRLAEPLLACAPHETCRALAVAPDRRHVTVATDREGAPRVALARVDVVSGEVHPVALPATPAAAAGADLTAAPPAGETVDPAGFPPAVDGGADQGRADWPPSTFFTALAAAEPPVRDLGGALFASDGALVAAWPAGEPFQPRFADPGLAADWARLAAALPPGELDLVSASADGSRLLVVADLAGAVLLVDRRAGAVRELRRLRPALDPARRPRRHVLRYPARDELPIPAVLTLPAAAAPAGAPLPAVVLPPDDPWHPRRGGYQPLVELLAGRGYAVLQPAPRGSAGFGRAFRAAGERQWGGAMLDDLADGVGWMVERGIADPDRVAIVGFGWGGYAAVAALAFTPDLYAAGVSVDGPVDLEALVRESRDPLAAAVLRRRIGDPDHFEEHRRMRRHSPLAHAGAIRAPLLRVDLEGGAWADPAGSERLVGVLRELGRPVESFAMAGSGGRLEGAAGVAVAEAVERFLARQFGAAFDGTAAGAGR